jgi:hypothetical protein
MFCFLAYFSSLAQTSYTLSATADAAVRNGNYSGINYGSDTALIVKGSTMSGFTRKSYLKFSLSGISAVTSAKIRIYGRNTDNTSNIAVSLYAVDNDNWTETGITWNNAPAVAGVPLASAQVNDQSKYYELDVTGFVKSQLAGDKMVSFLLRDSLNLNKNVVFNSKENNTNKPQLIISASGSVTPAANALLFIENPDKFPSNDHFVFSKIQIRWGRDTVYAANHDSLRLRIYNKGMNNLTVKNFVLSNSTAWKIDKIKGIKYVEGLSLPVSIPSGSYVDVIVKFIAADQATRVKVLHDTLTIISNDDKSPEKTVLLSGLWQKQGEGSNEPYAQEIINAFGFTTKTGYGQIDADKGDTLAPLKGDEIRPSYFVRADASKPVSIVQIAAYHGCCNTDPETIFWHTKGSNDLKTILTHVIKDGQSLMPRKKLPATPADATFSPTTAFGLKIGENDYLDAAKNPGGKTGIKVWKAFDASGNIIPNAYIIGNDYLATPYTNYDYQDNMYFIKNVRPEKGTAYFSKLSGTPSVLDFGEKLLQTANSLTLNLSSLGKAYTDGSRDPAINISSIVIAGENKSEFSAAMPLKTILNPQEKTTLTVSFKPLTEGFKIADLLIYYKNAAIPLRVPLYGIAKATGTTVNVNYRINSGSATTITLNNKIWSADTLYALGNLQPYTSKLTSVYNTEEDRLYFKEQHSDSAKKPWSYELPVANGNYVVRLHFAEIYWGVPGGNLNGGAGSRVMSVAMEGQLRLVNFDPTQEAGAAATAIVKNIPVTVTDGKLNIDFSSTVDRPMVCAVEVYSFVTAANKPVQEYLESKTDKAKAYPNPVQKTLTIQFPPQYAGDYNLQIADALGRIYEVGKTKLPAGGSNMDINISRLSLKPGFYYLRILSANAKPEMIKLVVE